MNKIFYRLALEILAVLIVMIFSLNIEAADKNKRTTQSDNKDQRITVMAIDSGELNFCGNRMGGFAATYRGKTIRIVFEFGQIASQLNGSPIEPYNLLCVEKLSFINKSIDAIGSWAGKDMDVDNFLAKKLFIPGKRDNKPAVL